VAPHTDLLDVARLAAARAAGYVRAARRPDVGAWHRKAKSDFVTEVDREAERLITETLLLGAPGSRVVGEELTGAGAAAGAEGAAGVTWVVDPLDGTTNFLHDYPMYAVSVAAVVRGGPVAAVVVDVLRDLVYWATAGGGAWCDARRLRVSALTDPSLALLGTGFPFKSPANRRLDEYLSQFRRILPQTSGIRRCGSAALDLAHVAEGRLDGFWEMGLAAWDVAAGILLVREAGGLVTDFTGGPAVVAPGDFVAGNPAIQQWLVATLRR
jgi:myo-inositol-1(or 4)-monophosphatase